MLSALSLEIMLRLFIPAGFYGLQAVLGVEIKAAVLEVEAVVGSSIVLVVVAAAAAAVAVAASLSPPASRTGRLKS